MPIDRSGTVHHPVKSLENITRESNLIYSFSIAPSSWNILAAERHIFVFLNYVAFL